MMNISAFALISSFLLLSFLLLPYLWRVPHFSDSFSPRSNAFPKLPILVPLTFKALPCSSRYELPSPKPQVSIFALVCLLFSGCDFCLGFTCILSSPLSFLSLPSLTLHTPRLAAMARHLLEFDVYFSYKQCEVHGILYLLRMLKMWSCVVFKFFLLN